jgi:hypothetical protein
MIRTIAFALFCSLVSIGVAPAQDAPKPPVTR